MLREKDTVIRRAMIIVDTFLIAVTFIAVYFLRRYFSLFYRLDIFPSVKVIAAATASLNDYLVLMFMAIPLWIAMLYWSGVYRPMRTRTIRDIIWAIVKAEVFFVLAFGALVFFFKMKFVSRLFFVLFVSAGSIALLAEKIAIFYIAHFVRRQGYNYRCVLIVGANPRAEAFVRKIKAHPGWGIRIAGILDYAKSSVGARVAGIKVKGTLDDLERIFHKTAIDEVIFVVPHSGLGKIDEALCVCETRGVRATIALDLFELKIAKARTTELDGIPLVTFETTIAREWQMFVKRAIDLIVSGIGFIVLSPFFFIIAVIIKLDSPGPVLFIQRRVGLNGRKFQMFKFRTMYKGAHQRISEFKDLNMMKGPVFKMKNDPRITRVGRYLRKFSVDELPQLANVFIGHMSLVGPRPPLFKEVL